jgi:hypothetical protein
MGLSRLLGAGTRCKEGVMSAYDATRELLESEKRERMEQIEGILRRLNPELTDEQMEKLVAQFWRRSGFE